MVKVETTFNARFGLTPEFAAELSKEASRFEADIQISCEGKQLHLDSLISILALDLHRGVKVAVIADGADELEAAKAISEKIAISQE